MRWLAARMTVFLPDPHRDTRAYIRDGDELRAGVGSGNGTEGRRRGLERKCGRGDNAIGPAAESGDGLDGGGLRNRNRTRIRRRASLRNRRISSFPRLAMAVSILMTPDAKSYEILSRIIAQAASGLKVMDLEAFDAAAKLATPAIPLENFMAELAVCLSLKLQTRPFGSNSVGFHEYSRRVAPASIAEGPGPDE